MQLVEVLVIQSHQITVQILQRRLVLLTIMDRHHTIHKKRHHQHQQKISNKKK